MKHDERVTRPVPSCSWQQCTCRNLCQFTERDSRALLLETSETGPRGQTRRRASAPGIYMYLDISIRQWMFMRHKIPTGPFFSLHIHMLSLDNGVPGTIFNPDNRTGRVTTHGFPAHHYIRNLPRRIKAPSILTRAGA